MPNTPKHTKGPWEVVEFDESIEIQANNGKKDNPDILADVWSKKDAHLIAAAPELLEALKNLLTSLQSPDIQTLKNGDKALIYFFEESDIEQVKQAIAKAEGQ